MQVPASAAVNEAVKLTRTFKKSSASGLVNAVLRKACGYDLDAAVFTDEIQRLMVLALPDGMWRNSSTKITRMKHWAS